MLRQKNSGFFHDHSSKKTQNFLANIDIWLIDLSDTQVYSEEVKGKFFSSLDDCEKRKALLFKNSQIQTRYILSHYALRKILSTYIKCEVSDITFKLGKYGKPRLLHYTPMHFSTSRSEDITICAISQKKEIGIDIELSRPINNMDSIVQVALSRKEREAFTLLPAQNKLSVFYRIWTRKEALLKYLGIGLSFPLTDITVWPLNLNLKHTCKAKIDAKWKWYDFLLTFNMQSYFASCYYPHEFNRIFLGIFTSNA